MRRRLDLDQRTDALYAALCEQEALLRGRVQQEQREMWLKIRDWHAALLLRHQVWCSRCNAVVIWASCRPAILKSTRVDSGGGCGVGC